MPKTLRRNAMHVMATADAKRRAADEAQMMPLTLDANDDAEHRADLADDGDAR